MSSLSINNANQKRPPPPPPPPPYNKLSKTSFILLLLSTLIDTSHIRSFPSYNIVIGLWSCYCAHYRLKQPIEYDYISKMMLVFGYVTFVTIVLDVIFLILWGREIVTGYSKSLKFSLILFAVNLLFKIVALFYAIQIILLGPTSTTTTNETNDTPQTKTSTRRDERRRQQPSPAGPDLDRTNRNCFMEEASAGEMTDGDYYDEDSVLNDHEELPSVPFQSEVPGLMSPELSRYYDGLMLTPAPPPPPHLIEGGYR